MAPKIVHGPKGMIKDRRKKQRRKNPSIKGGVELRGRRASTMRPLDMKKDIGRTIPAEMWPGIVRDLERRPEYPVVFRNERKGTVVTVARGDRGELLIGSTRRENADRRSPGKLAGKAAKAKRA